MTQTSDKPFLGFGLGLRAEHYQDILDRKPKNIDWFEILSENYMIDGGKPLYFLDAIRQDYPMVMHGVSMSLGSTDELDFEYLRQLKKLIERVEPRWFSDHLCWTGVDYKNMHDLLPLPYTEEALQVIGRNVMHAQDVLQRPLVLENVSSYVEFNASEMTEWEFLSEVCQATGCYLLLDINNIYVSACNHGFSATDFIQGVPAERIMQFHLAGHQNNGDYLIDTHDHAVCDGVWDLYHQALIQFGHVPTMVEWDDKIPPLQELLSELNKARAIASEVFDTNIAV